jgi:hypothetical protein
MAVVGEIVAGRFRLVRPIGAGGMGSVWQARDEILARDVAVKEIRPMTDLPPGHADVWARAVLEARTLARLTHPNVVRVYDVLRSDGRPWIVMELVVGRSLDVVVAKDGPFAPHDAARIGRAILDGLDAAHRAGVLHRDVKPHNVFLADDGRTLLGDFSIAVFDADALGWQDTADDVVVGSPHYVAPERVRGASTVETDMWSFGATLYWMVEGRAPFSRYRGAALLTAVATEEPDPPQRSGPLAEVVNGLLRRYPEDRLTAAEARVLLDAIATAGASPEPATPPPPAPAKAPTTRRLWRRTAVGAAATVLAAAVAAVLLTVTGRQPAVVPVAATHRPSLRCASAVDPRVVPADPPTGGTRSTVGNGVAVLPAGWVWQLDDGFAVALPQGWLRSTHGGAICFLDPAGRHALTVEAAPTAPDRTTYWEREEADLLAAGPPAAYRRIDISPALYQKGGADWEYTYLAESVRWHVLRRAFATAAGRSYVVSWTTADTEWDSDQRTFRTIMQSFELRNG